MKILVTGATGFIGRHVVEGLKDKYDVTALTREDCDLTKEIPSGEYDTIIHCAISTEDNDYGHRKNLKMIRNVIDVPHKKFINIGSGAELDTTRDINKFSKTYTVPYDWYGMAKFTISSIVFREGGYNLRVFGCFGIDEDPKRFITSNLKRLKFNQPIELHQDRLFDFIYVEDLVKIIEYYILNDGLPQTCNCVYEEKHTLFEIIEMMFKIKGTYDWTNIEKGGYGLSYIHEAPKFYHNLELIGLENGLKEIYENI